MLGSQPLLTTLAPRGISGLNARGMFTQDLVTLGLHSGVEATMLNTDQAQAALAEALRRANLILFTIVHGGFPMAVTVTFKWCPAMLASNMIRWN